MNEWTPDASLTWDAGTWTVRLNVTTANASIQWTDTYICKVNSTCTNSSATTIGSLTGQTTSLGTTGVKTHSVTGSAVTPSAGDKVVVMICHTNVSANMNQTFAWTPNQLVDSPFSSGATGTLSKT